MKKINLINEGFQVFAYADAKVINIKSKEASNVVYAFSKKSDVLYIGYTGADISNRLNAIYNWVPNVDNFTKQRNILRDLGFIDILIKEMDSANAAEEEKKRLIEEYGYPPYTAKK